MRNRNKDLVSKETGYNVIMQMLKASGKGITYSSVLDVCVRLLGLTPNVACALINDLQEDDKVLAQNGILYYKGN